MGYVVQCCYCVYVRCCYCFHCFPIAHCCYCCCVAMFDVLSCRPNFPGMALPERPERFGATLSQSTVNITLEMHINNGVTRKSQQAYIHISLRNNITRNSKQNTAPSPPLGSLPERPEPAGGQVAPEGAQVPSRYHAIL